MSDEKNTALAVKDQKTSVIKALAEKLECDPAKLVPMLQKTAFATCKTDEEFMAMCIVANTYGLNPILKEIYAFPSKGGNVVPIVGVDGWIKMMNNNPSFDGIDFEEGKDFCTAVIYRKDRAHPIKATEWLSECVGTSEPWKRWPKRMLRHKAMIQCARIAFGYSGIYDEDEGRRISEVQEISPNYKSIVAAPTGPTCMTGATGPTANANDLRSALGIGKAKAAAKTDGKGEKTASGEVADI